MPAVIDLPAVTLWRMLLPGSFWQDLVNNGGNLRVLAESLTQGNGPNNLYGDWRSWYNDSLILEGKKQGQLHCPLGTFPGVSDVPIIRNNIDIDFPPFDTEIPDQYRVDVFLLEFNQYVANNNLPSWFTFGCATITPAESQSGSYPNRPSRG